MNQYCIDKKTGKLIWRFNPGSYPDYLSVYDGVAYVGFCNNVLYALDDRTGGKLWEFRTGGPVVARPVVHNGKLYFGSWDCNFYCISKEGKLVWRTPTSQSSQSRLEPPEPTGAFPSEFTVNFEEGTAKKTDDTQERLADYGDEFKSSYAGSMKSDYVAGRKKGYIK